MVKDLVRVALERHGIIDRESKTKPGMVHMSSSSSEASYTDKTESSSGDKDVVKNEKSRNRYPRKTGYGTAVAHINMKTPEAAWYAYITIAGNSLWDYPLAAAVFPSSPSMMPGLGPSATPHNGGEPVELSKVFNITTPGGAHIWGCTPAGKLTKMEIKDSKSRKPQVSPGDPSSRKRIRLANRQNSTSGYAALDRVQEYAGVATPPTQLHHYENFADGYYWQYPACGWVQDWYGYFVPYQQLPWAPFYWAIQYPTQFPELDTRFSEEKSFTKDTNHPIIACGDIID
ncbi:MAG: hypothetical protein Q9225_004756 [Loekoesia sp. 1 TL-2023]